MFLRWGKTLQDDPDYSPIGPELLDIEVSTICSRACRWCYKSNRKVGDNMSFDTFKTILDKIPENLTQVAFGIGDLDANPDLIKMMDYCLKRGVVPNITINGDYLPVRRTKALVKRCGAISVSNYAKEKCYDAVKLLCGLGCKQVNIHQLVAKETFHQCIDLFYDVKHDARLKNLNAVVLLKLKPVGRGSQYHLLRAPHFAGLIWQAMLEKIPLGLDSCSAYEFLQTVKGHPRYKQFAMLAESCESGLFSYYINVYGEGYPCSFCEPHFDEAQMGVDVLNCEHFLKDVWYHDVTRNWRQDLIATGDNPLKCRKCLLSK
jgi:MoaA/NifB/PqqE/SkfB family radical SAM enzyme